MAACQPSAFSVSMGRPSPSFMQYPALLKCAAAHMLSSTLTATHTHSRMHLLQQFTGVSQQREPVILDEASCTRTSVGAGL